MSNLATPTQSNPQRFRARRFHGGASGDIKCAAVQRAVDPAVQDLPAGRGCHGMCAHIIGDIEGAIEVEDREEFVSAGFGSLYRAPLHHISGSAQEDCVGSHDVNILSALAALTPAFLGSYRGRL